MRLEKSCTSWMRLSANALSKALDVPVNRITAILNGQRGVTANTALRLARLMVAHVVGVRTRIRYEVKRIDEDYFEQEAF